MLVKKYNRIRDINEKGLQNKRMAKKMKNGHMVENAYYMGGNAYYTAGVDVIIRS